MHPHSPLGSACVRKRRSAAEKCSSQRADESEAASPSHSVLRHVLYIMPKTTWESSSAGSAASSENLKLLQLQLTSLPESSTTCSAPERHMTNPCSTNAKRRRSSVPRCAFAGRPHTLDFESLRQRKVDCSLGVGQYPGIWSPSQCWRTGRPPAIHRYERRSPHRNSVNITEPRPIVA